MFFFFFNDTATTEIYTLSLHDALPIYAANALHGPLTCHARYDLRGRRLQWRSEEHTSELQSRPHLVCRLLLEKKKKNQNDFLDSLYQMVHLVSEFRLVLSSLSTYTRYQ